MKACTSVFAVSDVSDDLTSRSCQKPHSRCGHYILQLWFLSFFFCFPRLFSAVGEECLRHFHTWCGPSANLECRSEMCCHWKYSTQKLHEKSCHLCTIARLRPAISSQLMHVSTIGKTLLNSNISSTCPHNMVNSQTQMSEISWWVWGTPANFNRFTPWLCYCTNIAQCRPNKLCTLFGRLLHWYTTPCPEKNGTTLFLPLTLPNAGPFSKLFHQQT